ncbi:TonB-dependent receptor [Lentisalinibacter orientalis]|uniref:TonB-dependent receptor n=1 Tax=Lentisalinibacter orientalis TaxID=2992241 RepID=UPI00386838EE
MGCLRIRNAALAASFAAAGGGEMNGLMLGYNSAGECCIRRSAQSGFDRKPASVVALIVVGALASTLPVSESAVAQEGAVIDEIKVTARKREESLLEVPETVTAFSEQQIERASIDDLGDIGLLVPNLYMTRRLDGFPNVSVRGMGAFGNTQGVGFYLDDVQLFSDASSRFGDLERIEVLKGPQGILYGGSNIGGAIKFVSTRPDPSAFGGSAKLRAGEDSYFDGSVQLNVPLGDGWAARFFGFSMTDDSYLVNPDTALLSGDVIPSDPDVGKTEESGARLTLSGSLTDRLSLYATARYNTLDGPNNVWIRELDGDLEHSNVVDTSFNPRHDRDTVGLSLELTYQLDSIAITSISSYTNTDSKRETDLDISNEFILDLFRPQELDVVTQELRFSSTGDGALQWQAGVYALNYDRDLDGELLVRGGFCFLDPGVCDPLPGPEAAELLVALPFEFSRREREQRAAFANFQYELSEQFEFSAGVRLDRWESSRRNLDSGLSGSQSETEVLGRASLAWFPNPGQTMVYGTISQGFEPGDFNLTNFAGEDTLFGYGPEEATQFELGYKDRLANDRIALSLAAFYIDYKDRQFELQASDPTGGFVEGIINAGDSTQWGFEGDLQWYLGDAWTASLGFGYVNAEWDDGTVSPVSGADLSGETPPNTADWSLTAALDYSRDLSAESRMFGRVQLRYKSDSATNSQFFDVPGDAFPAWDNPSFTVVDVTAGMEWRDWTFDIYVENLFDEEYYIDVQEFPNFAGSSLPTAQGSVVIGTLEQPRRVVVSARYAF